MKVDLLSLTQTALIIPSRTGIVYTNQVGGTECAHPKLEGVLVPVEYDVSLDNLKDSLSLKLCNLFPEGGAGLIDQSIAEKIQHLLDCSPYTKGIFIDWSKLDKSKEAWLYVKLKGNLDDTIECNTLKTAVLTWPNSD